jgi:hypothetical protein
MPEGIVPPPLASAQTYPGRLDTGAGTGAGGVVNGVGVGAAEGDGEGSSEGEGLGRGVATIDGDGCVRAAAGPGAGRCGRRPPIAPAPEAMAGPSQSAAARSARTSTAAIRTGGGSGRRRG